MPDLIDMCSDWVSPARLQEILSVDGVIKLADADYWAVPDTSEFLHVNALPCTHQPGRTYAMARICARDQDGSPLLDLMSSELVVIDSVREICDYRDLRPNELEALIGCPASYDDLIDMFVARYRDTRGIDKSSAKVSRLMVSALRRVESERCAPRAVFGFGRHQS